MEIKEGQTIYTVPWALVADRDGNLWLNPYHSARERGCGTAEMRVTKKDGNLIVDLRGVQNVTIEKEVLSPKIEYLPVALLLS